MSYVVLARKWRPTQFDEVVGQGHVARTLKNAIEQDRVHHAFLFCGARGVGKTSTARILAKALNCRNADAPTTEPCGECESCEQIATGQSVDVFEIDGASNRGINEIRELRESVRYAPSRDRYKVYIIDEVHMLTTEAFNALLKTLEEPPPHAKFIFATTEPQKIPVTILSRCQRYDFKRIGQADIVSHLQELADAEGMEVEKGALQVLARQAAGGMRDAVSLLDQVVSFAEGKVTEEGVVEVLGVANRRHLFELSDAVIARNTEAALLVLDEVNRYGYDLGQFASEFLSHLRDLMVVKVVEHPERVTEMTGTELESARKQIGEVDESLLHRMFSVVMTAAQEMSRSAFPKLVFEMALVRMAQLEPLAGLDVMIDRLVELEEQFDGEPMPMMPAQKKRRDLTEASSAAGAESGRPGEAGRSGEARAAAPTETQPRTDEAQVPTNAETQPRTDEAQVPTNAETQPRTDEAETAGRGTEPRPPVEEPGSPPPVEDPEPTPEKHPGRTPVEPPPSEDEPPVDEPEVPERRDEPIEDPEPKPDPVEEPEPEPEPVEEPEPEPEPAEEPPPKGEPVRPPPGRLPDEPSEPPGDDTGGHETAGETAGETADDGPDRHEPIEPLPLSKLEEMGPSARWKHVVETLRTRSSPIAAAAEHAYVERFEDGRIELSFADKYLDFINEGQRLERLREVVHALFGNAWEVVVATRDDSSGAPTKTLAQERDEDRNRRRNRLETELRESAVVQQVKEVFDVPEDEVRVQVALFDDPM